MRRSCGEKPKSLGEDLAMGLEHFNKISMALLRGNGESGLAFIVGGSRLGTFFEKQLA